MDDKSILDTIKHMLGGLDSGEDDHFNTDIIVHINSAFEVLHQLGLGPEEGFYIEDNSATWGDYLTNSKCVRLVSTYIYLFVRKSFDPPANSFLLEAINKDLKEYEWRLNVLANEMHNYTNQ